MRMWMLPPRLLCDRHLLGEHGELHKFLHTWKKKYSITGWIQSNAIEPQSYRSRHNELALEMVKRGFSHLSPLPQPNFKYLPPDQQSYQVNKGDSLIALIGRCSSCKRRLKKMLENEDKYDMMGIAEALSQVSEPINFEEETEMATKKNPQAGASTTKKAATAKPAKQAAAPEKDPNVTTLADLANESGKSATVLRQKLRATEGIEKPEGRWQWKNNSKELKAVRTALGI